MPVGEGLRRVAAIDLGTNSTHLLIASVDPQLRTFQVLLAEKSTTRLGERDPDTGDLSPEAMERARLALRHCRELASSHDVEEIVCVATSAMREAPNGLAFLEEVERDFGLKTEVISGPEEARLIYLGVLSGMDFAEQPHYILDIGGGSTELILADAGDARALTSSRVGAVRLQRDFIRQEPLDRKRVQFLRAFIQGSMEPAVEKVRRRLEPDETPVLVATSGTAMAAAALLAVDRPELKGRLHGAEFSRDALDALVQRVLPLTPEQRRALPGINARRAEIIVPGLLVLQQAM
ncbi:MAG: Ppx/GppA phosphatase family protein, partial [Prochlorococcaceae cyanobacterium]